MIKDLPKQIQDYLFSDNKPFIELAIKFVADKGLSLKEFIEEYNTKRRIIYNNDNINSIMPFNYSLYLNKKNELLVLKIEEYYSLKLAEMINTNEELIIWGIKAKAINLENNGE